MSKISFFYDSPSVYKVTLKALARRDFIIMEANEGSGVIKAVTRKKLLKPVVNFEVHVNSISEKQTALNINSKIKKSWLTPDGYEAKAEQKFINTLYKCFENI
jgi:hypothetical protein